MQLAVGCTANIITCVQNSVSLHVIHTALGANVFDAKDFLALHMHCTDELDALCTLTIMGKTKKH